MQGLNRILTRSTEILVSMLLFAMAAALLLEVALRFIFSTSLPWTSEFSRYAMIWITFFGAALAIKGREHIRVTFFVTLLPERLWRHVLVLINLVLMVFVGALLRYGITITASEMKMRTAAMDIPFGLVVAALPVSAALMLIYLLADTADLLKSETVTFGEEKGL